MESRFSSQVNAVLEEAGWQPGRRVDTLAFGWSRELRQRGFKSFPYVEQILVEFGGLSVAVRSRSSFVLNPMVALRYQIEVSGFDWDGTTDDFFARLADLGERMSSWEECRELLARHEKDSPTAFGLSIGGCVATVGEDLTVFRVGRFRVVDAGTKP